MSKTITIDDDAYQLLASLKQNAEDSLSKVIRRHLVSVARSDGELPAAEGSDLPAVDVEALKRIRMGRGRGTHEFD